MPSFDSKWSHPFEQNLGMEEAKKRDKSLRWHSEGLYQLMIGQERKIYQEIEKGCPEEKRKNKYKHMERGILKEIRSWIKKRNCQLDQIGLRDAVRRLSSGFRNTTSMVSWVWTISEGQ